MYGKSLSLMVGIIFYFIVAAFMTGASAANVSAATVVVTDPVTSTSWGSHTYVSGTDANSTVNGTFTTGTSGGNPGQYIDGVQNFVPPGNSLVIFPSIVATYEPSVQGQITTIDFVRFNTLFGIRTVLARIYRK